MYLYRIQGEKRVYYFRKTHIQPDDLQLLHDAGIKVNVEKKTPHVTIEDLILQMELQQYERQRNP